MSKKLKYIMGDLVQRALDGKYDIIVHGCNCFNNMGAGIAVPIKHNFPDAYLADRATQYGSKEKLGKFTIGRYKDMFVINAYTQFEYGSGKMNADYDAIREVFSVLNIMFRKRKVGIPLIGAGLAGGDWKVIKDIIEEVAPDLDIEVVVLDDSGKRIVENAYIGSSDFEPCWVYEVAPPTGNILNLKSLDE